MALLLAVILLPGNAAATVITQLNVSNEDLGISGNFATVTLNVLGNTASLKLDANEAILNPVANFGIDKFFFNTNLTLALSDFTSLPTGWIILPGQQADGFGNSTIESKSTGGTRLDPLEFSITNTTINDENQFVIANMDGHHSAAHIGGIDLNGKGITFVTDGAPVPEPSTLFSLVADWQVWD